MAESTPKSNFQGRCVTNTESSWIDEVKNSSNRERSRASRSRSRIPKAQKIFLRRNRNRIRYNVDPVTELGLGTFKTDFVAGFVIGLTLSFIVTGYLVIRNFNCGVNI